MEMWREKPAAGVVVPTLHLPVEDRRRNAYFMSVQRIKEERILESSSEEDDDDARYTGGEERTGRQLLKLSINR